VPAQSLEFHGTGIAAIEALFVRRLFEIEQWVSPVDEVSVSEGIRPAIYRYVATRRADKGFQARLRERLEKDREVLERLAE
jgi:hypothetical protein